MFPGCCLFFKMRPVKQKWLLEVSQVSWNLKKCHELQVPWLLSFLHFSWHHDTHDTTIEKNFLKKQIFPRGSISVKSVPKDLGLNIKAVTRCSRPDLNCSNFPLEITLTRFLRLRNGRPTAMELATCPTSNRRFLTCRSVACSCWASYTRPVWTELSGFTDGGKVGFVAFHSFLIPAVHGVCLTCILSQPAGPEFSSSRFEVRGSIENGSRYLALTIRASFSLFGIGPEIRGGGADDWDS